MKRIITLCAIALAASCLASAQTVRVSLNKQYTDSMNFQLPDKVIKLKMPLLTIANPKYDFTAKLHKIVTQLATHDYDNSVFTVKLHYAGVGISIIIDSQDVIDTDSVKFLGDLFVGRKHFVLLEDDDNKELLKTFFKKARGKEAIFERTFEKVPVIIMPEPTHYKAMYNERKRSIQVNEFIVNSNDKLHKTPATIQEPTQEPSIDEDDAFKIDVELFNE